MSISRSGEVFSAVNSLDDAECPGLLVRTVVHRDDNKNHFEEWLEFSPEAIFILQTNYRKKHQCKRKNRADSMDASKKRSQVLKLLWLISQFKHQVTGSKGNLIFEYHNKKTSVQIL